MSSENPNAAFAMGSPAFENFAAEHENTMRRAVKQLLESKRDEARRAGDGKLATKFINFSNHAGKRVRLRQFVAERAIPEFLAAKSAGTLKEGETFFQWLMRWLFEEGNWQKVLEFILSLLA